LNYFDNGVEICVRCYYACETCSGSFSDNCLTCNILNFRDGANVSIDNVCPCLKGYYDDFNQN